MKTKAAFINSQEHNKIFEVFDNGMVAKLKETFELPDKVILEKDFDKYKTYLAGTEYLFSTWGMPQLDVQTIKKYLPSLKAVFYGAGSVRTFAYPFLCCGVKVFSGWMANAVPVAEYTVSQIVLASKGFYQGLRRQHKEGRNAFSRFSRTFPGNYNIKVGVLGVGAIGSLVLEKLKQFHIETYAYDPFVDDLKITSLNAKRASLKEIFTECQVITNHIANLPSTRGILNYKYFSMMKSNATFINTGRGAQIVEADLVRAMIEKPDRTALLDVTDPEPAPDESPLWNTPNVFLTPHIAGSINNELARMGSYVVSDCEAFIQGKPTRYEITVKMLETMA